MKNPIARALMALAAAALGESRQQWSMAMRVEFETEVAEADRLRFAFGCLIGAWRDMVSRAEGRFTLTSYGLALGLIMPMAALQVGCALFGMPYLYPGGEGLSHAMLVGQEHEALLRSIYQAAIVPLALLQLAIGYGHVRVAWAMLERDWAVVMRSGLCTLASAATLILFMSILFLNSRQAMLQGAILGIELGIAVILARWHAQLPTTGIAQPG